MNNLAGPQPGEKRPREVAEGQETQPQPEEMVIEEPPSPEAEGKKEKPVFPEFTRKKEEKPLTQEQPVPSPPSAAAGEIGEIEVVFGSPVNTEEQAFNLQEQINSTANR